MSAETSGVEAGLDTVLFVEWCEAVNARLTRAAELRSLLHHLGEIVQRISSEVRHLEHDAPPMPALTNAEASILEDAIAAYSAELRVPASSSAWEQTRYRRSIALDTRVVLGVQLKLPGALALEETRLATRGPRR